MPTRDEAAKARDGIGPALPGNQWVAQLRAEGARGDAAEAALLATDEAAAEVLLVALTKAKALMAKARDTAQDLLAGAEDEAEKLLEVAQASAQRLLLASDHGLDPSFPTTEAQRVADASAAAFAVCAAQADAVASLRQRQVNAAEVLLNARLDAH